MKIIFAGTPEFAEVALQSLLRAGFDIPLILTQPDRPSGRGLQLHASAVKQSALARHIEVAQPMSLRLDGKYPDVARQAHDRLRAIPHDAMVVAAYGLILPPSILQIARLGCINIHASLLPRWRGAAPIHRAIEAGDSVTGVTIMQMDEGLDTGPMFLAERLPIESDDTTATMHDKLAALGARLIVEALRELEQNTLKARPQPETGANYAAKVTKAEALLDFSQSSTVLARKVCAFNPFPGAFGTIDGVAVKFWRASALAVETAAAPGQVLSADGSDGVLIACGEGVLRVDELQKPGGKRLPSGEFLKGFPLEGRRFR